MNQQMPYQYFDDAFMNHSYLSEKWLVHFLEDMKTKVEWNDDDETQLQEEIKHTKMFRYALKKMGKPIVDDIKFSIQESLYEKIGGIEFNKISERKEFNIAIYIIERRANFLYKMYLKHGTNEHYKNVVIETLNDEKRHLLHQKKDIGHSEYLSNLLEVDKKIFGEYLNNRYSASISGAGVFTNMDYWKDLYEGRLLQ